MTDHVRNEKYAVQYRVEWLNPEFHAMLALGFPEFLGRWSGWATNNMSEAQMAEEQRKIVRLMELDAERLGTSVKGKYRVHETGRQPWSRR